MQHHSGRQPGREDEAGTRLGQRDPVRMEGITASQGGIGAEGETQAGRRTGRKEEEDAIFVSLFPSTAPFPILIRVASGQHQGIVTGKREDGGGRRYIPQSRGRVESRRAVRQFVCLKSRVNGVAKSGVGGWMCG